MSDQAILRCGQCNKPFDKETTLKRHGYYCQSRKSGAAPRARSCAGCAKSKVRCDGGKEGCGRCRARGLECRYPAKASRAKTPRAAVGEAEHITSWGDEYSSITGGAQGLSDDGNLLESMASVDFFDLGAGLPEWDDPGTRFGDFTSTQSTGLANERTKPSKLWPNRPWIPTIDHMHDAHPLLNESIPQSPTYTLLRSLNQRPGRQNGEQRTADLILHTLKSYPQMMLRHNTLPPFIHPRLVESASDEENDNMEPLTNCLNLVHMISSGIRGSRKLFWRNVRTECELLCVEPESLNKWELLAAMQALSIYILIRLDEGETEHNNLDFLILAAMGTISQQLAVRDMMCNTRTMPCDYEPSWRNWLYEESRRRLGVVYRVINMLVYFEPSTMCQLQTDLILAPLPAKKQLWEAGDENGWKTESERDVGVPSSFGLAANGDLVKLEQSQSHCSDTVFLPVERKTANWEEWCSGMDGFGGLVMLAASLVV